MNEMTVCMIGVSGFSGTGKTSLIEGVIPLLKKEGFAVGILKHAHSGIAVDSAGKDTERFYRAGADFVLAHDVSQMYMRQRAEDQDLAGALNRFPRELDLIIVEGHKGASLPKIWVPGRKPDMKGARRGDVRIRSVEAGGTAKAFAFIRRKMEEFHNSRPLKAGLLAGGRSTRMGRPKAFLSIRGKTMMERSYETTRQVIDEVVLLGRTPVPASMENVNVIPDVPRAEGPIAGIAGAFRWDPASVWLISGVDTPLMDTGALHWVLAQRRPGAWAVMPTLDGRTVEAVGACYEPAIYSFIEELRLRGKYALQAISDHPRVITPKIPSSLAHAWRNVNTQEEWKRFLGKRKKR